MKFKANQRILNGMLMKEIKDLNATIRRHGEAYMARDLLPQFRELVTKVEKIEGSLNYKLNDGPIHNHSIRIAKLEEKTCKHYVGNEASRGSFASLFPRVEKLEKMPALIDDHIKRLADHDESIEALSETVDQLSTCKCEAGNQMLKRISEQGMDILELKKRWIGMDEGIKAALKTIPDVEILKTQMHNLLSAHHNMTGEILKQKVFLAKAQAILDRAGCTAKEISRIQEGDYRNEDGCQCAEGCQRAKRVQHGQAR